MDAQVQDVRDRLTEQDRYKAIICAKAVGVRSEHLIRCAARRSLFMHCGRRRKLFYVGEPQVNDAAVLLGFTRVESVAWFKHVGVCSVCGDVMDLPMPDYEILRLFAVVSGSIAALVGGGFLIDWMFS
jgi:hypothetical protein